MKRAYQLVLVLKSSLKDADRKKVIDSVKGWLKDFKIAKENEWGDKALSYNIKKQGTGFFLDVNFEGDAIPSDFEKKIQSEENILRHLLLRTK